VNKASKAVKLAKRNFEKQIAKKIKSDTKSGAIKLQVLENASMENRSTKRQNV